jgi:hypothetical protein
MLDIFVTFWVVLARPPPARSTLIERRRADRRGAPAEWSSRP